MSDITISLSDSEQTALAQLLDAAVRNGGLQLAPAAVHFMTKMQTESNAAAPATTPNPGEPRA
jgi:hypothetical protein